MSGSGRARGCDSPAPLTCLFQIISHRYERGAKLLNTNSIYKNWASIFDKDAVLTSALLDRLLHHAETVLIEGKSYRSKDQVEV